MQLRKEQVDPTHIKLDIAADQSEIDQVKATVLTQLAKNVKVPGFREGKAPANMVEKHTDEAVLQSQVVDELVNRLYFQAVQQEELRPVAQPEITLTKFVPFSALEISAKVEVVGEIKLADYKKVTAKKESVSVTDKDVDDILENLRQRTATKKEVKRSAKAADEVVIDFLGTDSKSKEPIAGADGKDYPLVLGSGSFIPGFEEKLIGLKPGDETSFEITFPADYGVASLQSKPVNFAVTVKEVREMGLPELNDAFAKTAGPFENLDGLKNDIRTQLSGERQREADRKYVNDIIEQVAKKSEFAIPDSLVTEEMARIEDEEKRNLAYRGQTWSEHLKEEGLTAEEHLERQREPALQRIKAGLVLGEIANEQNIAVTPEELEVRIQLLKGRYEDAAMRAELDKPEARREIHSQLLTEKTFEYLLQK